MTIETSKITLVENRLWVNIRVSWDLWNYNNYFFFFWYDEDHGVYIVGGHLACMMWAMHMIVALCSALICSVCHCHSACLSCSWNSHLFSQNPDRIQFRWIDIHINGRREEKKRKLWRWSLEILFGVRQIWVVHQSFFQLVCFLYTESKYLVISEVQSRKQHT